MAQLPTGPDETPTYIYNPSRDDFIHNFDGKPVTLPSRKISSFPKYLADHLATHLAQKLAFEDDRRIHHETKIEEWKKKIYEVELDYE